MCDVVTWQARCHPPGTIVFTMLLIPVFTTAVPRHAERCGHAVLVTGFPFPSSVYFRVVGASGRLTSTGSTVSQPSNVAPDSGLAASAGRGGSVVPAGCCDGRVHKSTTSTDDGRSSDDRRSHTRVARCGWLRRTHPIRPRDGSGVVWRARQTDRFAPRGLSRA